MRSAQDAGRVPDDATPGEALQTAALAVSLFVATAALFWPATGNDFVSLDDPNYVFGNRQVLGGLSWDNLRWAFTTFHASHWHPLTWLSLMLDAQMFGKAPYGFHAVNVLLHAGNAVWLLLALRRLTRALWPSALVAALFAVHPLRVESVAWVTERKDVLSAACFLLALLAYAGYARRGGIGRYLLVAVAFALGLLAKPMVVTLPVVLLLLDLWPLRRWTASVRPLSLLLEKLPLFALSLASVIMTLLAGSSQGAVSDLHAMPLPVRLANAAIAYLAYLGAALWPSGLAAVYPHRGVLGAEPAAALLWPGVLAGAVLIAVSAMACAGIARRPYLFVGWWWYVVMLLPVSGLVQAGFQARADRFTYLPMIGIGIAVVWAGRDLLARRPLLRPVAAGLVLSALAGAAAVTRAQLATWRDSVALFERALAVTDDNYFAHGNLAAVLVAMGRDDDAIAHYQAALQIHPRYATALTGLASIYVRRGRLDEAAGLDERALAEEPSSPVVLTNLGAVRVQQGRSDEAVAYFERAVALAPDYAMAHTNLGVIAFRQGQVDRAAEHFATVVALTPNAASAHTNLGTARMQQGRWAEAAAEFETVLRLQPGNADAQRNLAAARARMGIP